MIDSPCKNCKNRKLACQDHCPLYKEFKEKLNAMNEKKRAADQFNHYRCDKVRNPKIERERIHD